MALNPVCVPFLLQLMIIVQLHKDKELLFRVKKDIILFQGKKLRQKALYNSI